MVAKKSAKKVAKRSAKKTSRRRKRKPKDRSSIAIQDQISHPIQTVYSLFFLMGVVEEVDEIHIPYQGDNYKVTIALPLIKYGLAYPGDDTKALVDDGWHIENISPSDIEPFSRIFFAVDNARVAEMYSRADPNVKNTSIPEERLLIEMKRRRMPEPDRNYRFARDDGSELTVPDFTWEDYRLVFFMDGAYWHSIKDDQALIKEIKSSRKMRDTIVDKRADKVRKDGAIRSELSARGWTVLTCTDDDIETPEGLREVVSMISRAMETIESVRQIASDEAAPSGGDSGDDNVMDILSNPSEEGGGKTSGGTHSDGDPEGEDSSEVGREGGLDTDASPEKSSVSPTEGLGEESSMNTPGVQEDPSGKHTGSPREDPKDISGEPDEEPNGDTGDGFVASLLE